MIKPKFIDTIRIVFTILTMLSFNNCSTTTRPDTDLVVTEAKSVVKRAEVVKTKIENKTSRPLEVVEIIDALKSSVENLLGVEKDQTEYIETLETRVLDMENSFRYKVGGYVLWIGSITALLIGLYVALRLYLKFGNPTGVVGAFLK